MRKKKPEVTEKTYSYKEADDLYELVIIQDKSLGEVVDIVKEDVAVSQLYYFLGKYSIPYEDGKCYSWFMEYKEDEIRNNIKIENENVTDEDKVRSIVTDSEGQIVRWIKKYHTDKDIGSFNKNIYKKLNRMYILMIILLISFMGYIIFV